MKSLLRTAVTAALLLGVGAAFAAEVTPVGTWKTIDDETGKPKSIVKIATKAAAANATIALLLRARLPIRKTSP